MREREAGKAIVGAGRRLCDGGYVVSNDGNISVRLDDGSILITPSGVSKGALSPDDLVRLSPEGKVLARGARAPSSESKMHLRVYREDSSVGAVVHAHPIYATSYAIAGIPLDEPILSEAMIQVGAVPVAGYAKPGTEGVPESVAPFVRDYGAVLLANHGALTWGASLEEALAHMEVLENYAHISYIVRQLGGGRGLSEAQVAEMADVRAGFGLSPVRMPRGLSVTKNVGHVVPRTSSAKEER